MSPEQIQALCESNGRGSCAFGKAACAFSRHLFFADISAVKYSNPTVRPKTNDCGWYTSRASTQKDYLEVRMHAAVA